MKVKLGPVLAQYEGKARFVERDDAAKRGVLRAEGREIKGQGSAKATVTAALAPAPEGTRVSVETDLAIVGRLAQMGRGLIAEVSGKLLGEFASNLERELAAPPAPAAAAPVPAASISPSAPSASEAGSPPPTGPPRAPSATPMPPMPARPAREAVPVDLLATAGVPVLKRVIPLAIGAALLAAAAIWLLKA